VIKNAQIEDTTLGFDRGCLTCVLALDYGDDSGQCFSLPILDEWVEGRRVGTAYGTEAIIDILQTVGVGSWEELRGKHVRTSIEDGLVRRIGNILKDVWFSPEELAKAMGVT